MDDRPILATLTGEYFQPVRLRRQISGEVCLLAYNPGRSLLVFPPSCDISIRNATPTPADFLSITGGHRTLRPVTW